MPEHLFFELVSRKLSGTANSQELRELNALIGADPALKKIYLELTEPDRTTEEDEIKAQQSFALHQAKMHLNVNSSVPIAQTLQLPNRMAKTYLRLMTGVAAVLAISFASYFYYSGTKNQVLSNIVSTKKGSKSNITLPDGTSVWLNSDSKLQYGNNFAGNIREVWLTGEAFFDVKKDAAHPFVIHTDNMNIKVLGTAFNVKSYKEDAFIETSLIRGRIEVSFNDRPAEKIILHPREKLTVSRNKNAANTQISGNTGLSKIKLDNLTTLNHDNSVAETAWMNNEVAFNNTSLIDIAPILERRFDLEIIFKDESVKTYRYTGLYKDQDLNRILLVMQMSKHFNYKLDGKTLTITL